MVRKRIRGGIYLYHQYRDLAGVTRQTYLGPEDAETLARWESLTEEELASTRPLAEIAAAYAAAGGAALEHGPFRVIKLEESLAVPVFSRAHVSLVNVPEPARFARHKLLVSESRDVGFATKAEKDRRQAANLLDVLLTEHPVAVRSAKRALDARGRGWTSRVEKALRKLGADAPALPS